MTIIKFECEGTAKMEYANFRSLFYVKIDFSQFIGENTAAEDSLCCVDYWPAFSMLVVVTSRQ